MIAGEQSHTVRVTLSGYDGGWLGGPGLVVTILDCEAPVTTKIPRQRDQPAACQPVITEYNYPQ